MNILRTIPFALLLLCLGCEGWEWYPQLSPSDDDDSAIEATMEIRLLRPAPDEVPAAPSVPVRVHIEGGSWFRQVTVDGQVLQPANDAAGATFEGAIGLQAGEHDLTVFVEAIDGRVVVETFSIEVGEAPAAQPDTPDSGATR